MTEKKFTLSSLQFQYTLDQINVVAVQAPVVQRVDNAIRQLNHYPVDKCWRHKLHYPLDSDLSSG